MAEGNNGAGDGTKVQKIVLRHRGGSRKGQTDELPLKDNPEISIGRDPSATVRFAPDSDDLVSRNHATITQDPGEALRFTLTDLGSRNGTFVNRQRVSGTVALNPGDVIQLGAGGPELEFDLDPRPAAAVKATRIADAPAPPPTRMSESAPAAAARAGIGKETVERMISSSQRSNRSTVVVIAAAMVVLVAAVAAWFLLRSSSVERTVTELQRDQDATRRKVESQPSTAREIAGRFGGSSVLIEFSWKLEYTPSGAQVYHRFIKGKPAYLQTSKGLEPWLITDSEGGTNEPITGAGSGSGFAVTANGFILTNRHVAANWHTSYQLPLPGTVFRETQEGYEEVGELGQEGARFLGNWVPAKALHVDGRMSGKLMEGRLNYLDVTFPKTKLRIPARLVRVSDRADVALIRIDLPTDVPPVELYDNYAEVQPGDAVTVLGYPGVSPDVAVRVRQVDPLNPQDEWKEIPDPTVTAGHIGRVIRGETPVGAEGSYEYWSEVGDVFQLDVNATGAGNSGGPVFDERGRVIGIFTYSRETDVRISFAVPIRYGMELMGITPVTQ